MTSNEHPSVWILAVDGASRNNPGMAGAGIHITKDNKTICKEGFFLGIKTNNEAEYYALLLGLFVLDKYVTPDDVVQVKSDSQLLVKQLSGEYKVKKPHLQPLHAIGSGMLRAYNATVIHVLRDNNTIADAMANYGIDKKKPVPDAFVTLLNTYELSL